MKHTRLYKYQIEGVKRIQAFGGRCLLADQQGLGKTIQALYWAWKYLPDDPPGPIVVVCPSSAKGHWEREALKHLGLRVEVLYGQSVPDYTFAPTNPNQIYVLNYDILTQARRDGKRRETERTWAYYLNALKPRLVIGDECHYVKTNTAARTRAFRRLCRSVPHVLLLSGTPLTNKPTDLWPALNILHPTEFPAFFPFATLYTNAYRAPWGWMYRGARNLDQLHALLKRTCFPAGTLIQCKRGTIPIETLVESESCEEVLCYDHASASLLWKPISAHSVTAAPDQMVRIVHEKGEFCCTPGHLVWTKNGYQRADSLVPDIFLSVVQKTGWAGVEDPAEVLLGSLRSEAPGIVGGVKEKNDHDEMGTDPEGAGSTKNHLPTMREGVLGGSEPGYVLGLLRNEVGREWVSPAASKDSVGKEAHQLSTMRGGDGVEEEKVVLLEEMRRGVEMGQNTACGTDAAEMAGFETPTQTSYSVGVAPPVVRISNSDQSRSGAFSGGAGLLFDGGPSSPARETRCGDRREDPREQETESKRSLEGKGIVGSRVVSVTILKPSDRFWPFGGGSGDRVYDIEVADAHNFFADNCLVHNCMIRRLKADVLPDLPAKTRTVVPVEIDRREYAKAELDFLGWLAKESPGAAARARKAEEITRLNGLKQLAGRLKVPGVSAWIRDFFAASDEKLLVGATHRRVTHALVEEFKSHNPILVDGDCSDREKTAAFDKFNMDESCRLLVGNTQAAGVVWSCRATSKVALCELPWTPGECLQFEDRAHGINRGVAGVPVESYWLVAPDTIDGDLCDILERKAGWLDQTLDGGGSADELDVHAQVVSLMKRRAS